MEKKTCSNRKEPEKWFFRKLLLIMKLTMLFILMTFGQLLAVQSYSQTTRLNLNLRGATIEEVISNIEKTTDFYFLYNKKIVDVERKVDIAAENKKITEVLDLLFNNSGVSYTIVGRQIVLSGNEVMQQPKSVSGSVTDSSGAPLPGVTVVLKGSTQGTITDIDGKYVLGNVSGNATLVYSFVGMKTQEIPVSGKTTINVVLSEESIGLEEVVAIGYGTMKKSDLTGSVSQVRNEDLEAVPVYNMAQALKAGASGVRVTQNSGQPGSRIEVRIRGGNSMIGDNQPLYVVDGFPVTGGINFLNPEDIESVDILKDASATAIYGARGANGVVIITSKRGKSGQKGKIEINSFYGIQEEIERYDLLNAKEYAEVANEWLKNGGQEPYFNLDEVENPGTDWQDVIFRTAPIQNHTITFSGSTEKTHFSLSGNYYDQDGIIINTGVKRGSARLNLDHEMNSWLKVAVNLNLSRRQNNSVPVDNGYRGGGSVLSAAASAPPTLPVYDEDGLPTQVEKFYNFGSADMRNPLIFAEQKTSILANTVVGNTSFEIRLTDELSFKTLLGIEYENALTDKFTPIIFENDRGYGEQSNSYHNSFLNENILTYSRDFANDHHLTVMGGYTYQTDMSRNSGIGVTGFSNNTTENYDLSAAESVNNPWSGISRWKLASWLARANYSFNNKYLVTASIRADGSSRFGSDHKWGVFPSAAFAWRISEESFMLDQDLISDLKFRASYGVTGNTALDPYQSLDRMKSVKTIYANQEDEIGFSPDGISNSDLKWESTAQIDLGFDLGVLENRLRLTADYYKKKTTDLLASVPLPPSVGFGSIYQNIGEIENQGFEFTLNADILRSSKVNWNVSANISTNRNKVVKLAGGSDIFSSGQGAVWSSTNIAREGEPLGVFYGYVEDGLDEDGFIRYKDQLTVDSDGDGIPDAGDGVINSLDRVILGNPNPDFFYGFNSNLSWKNFELDVILDGVYGNQIFNATKGTHLNSFQRGNNQFKDIIGNYWTADNPDPNAKYPRISSATSMDFSNRFIENGSYLRVKSLKLAYNLPVKKLGISCFDFVQVYLSGTNLLTFTNYSGLDPEVNTRGSDSQGVEDRLRMGYDQSGYPNAKTYAVGLKLNF